MLVLRILREGTEGRPLDMRCELVTTFQSRTEANGRAWPGLFQSLFPVHASPDRILVTVGLAFVAPVSQRG